MSSGRSFLVTGGNGFIGAWTVRRLLAEGARVVSFDRDARSQILEQVLDPPELERLERWEGDVTDPAALERALDASRADGVIHMAALQVPACRADPLAGGSVNVLGTLNVFEAVRRRRDRIRAVVYASSAAVAGPSEEYSRPIPDDAHHRPRTHYGVFKLAGEGGARVYWLDHGIPSAGIRPLVVYGVGRELGITSGPTKAIKAALLGRPYTIGFSGLTGFQYVADVAEAFVACAHARLHGAHVLNLRGDLLDVAAFVRIVDEVLPGAAGLIRVEGGPLPIACDFLQTGLDTLIGALPRTPVAEGVRLTASRFRELRARGRLREEDLAS